MKVGDKIQMIQDHRNLGNEEVLEVNEVFDNYIVVGKETMRTTHLYNNEIDVIFKRFEPEQPKMGTRHNNGKLRWRNFPKFLIRPVIEVAHFGETKYKTFNFLKGLSVMDTLDSLDRHRDAIDDPNLSDYDEESQCHHLAHIAWNALVALYMIHNRPELDDRYRGDNNETTTD